MLLIDHDFYFTAFVIHPFIRSFIREISNLMTEKIILIDYDDDDDEDHCKCVIQKPSNIQFVVVVVAVDHDHDFFIAEKI
ncbi:hypothetical protein DERF_013088 [Dermatophagoides farinae]|uniref:Uncharacterized protein n=1 Tax=Dermatophagoides farinae TaxID=6954 RepID=A0A922HQT0_DERFA|nr:hypothetical protein DERF_013088 [Dermatophagoides farinae]